MVTSIPGAYVGGLRYVDVVSDAARGRVFLHGAQLVSWLPGGASASPVWLSDRAIFADAVAIRGGVPICFPWFGPNTPVVGGPSHGLARLASWRVEQLSEGEAGAGVVTLVVDEHTVAPEPGWQRAFRLRDTETGPVGFTARMVVSLGDALGLRLEVRNTGARAIGFEAALHGYYAVTDVARARVEGLEGVAFLERAAGSSGVAAVEKAPVRFAGEVDRLYAGAPDTVRLVDEVSGEALRLTASGAEDWVVWNPAAEKAGQLEDLGEEQWRTMVCLEPARIGGAMVWLEPGEEYSLGVAVERQGA